jgi:hypothetical protein
MGHNPRLFEVIQAGIAATAKMFHNPSGWAGAGNAARSFTQEHALSMQLHAHATNARM